MNACVNSGKCPKLEFAIENTNSIDFEVGNENIVEFEIGSVEGTSGTKDYNKLINQPSINNITLIDNKTSEDLGLQDEMHELTNLEIEKIWKG